MNYNSIALSIVLVFFAPTMVGAKTWQVHMLNQSDQGAMVFKPAFIQVQPGDQVDFVPVDTGHNTQSVVVPEQAQPWQSKTDEKISIKLIQEGVYVYQCSNHQIMGMVGVIQVGTPTNLSKAQAFAKQWQAEVVMNKQRLDDYLKKIK